jgi:flagellar assembly factor FliW
MPAAVADAPASSPATAPRTIATRLFGDLDVPDDAIFRFPDGLPAFDAQREFALLPAAREGTWWLQSTEEPGLAFLLADPFRVKPGYAVDLSPGDARALALEAPEDALVLAVVVLPADRGAPATVNLRAPVVLNLATRTGRQVVSRSEADSMAHPADLAALPSRGADPARR